MEILVEAAANYISSSLGRGNKSIIKHLEMLKAKWPWKHMKGLFLGTQLFPQAVLFICTK